MVDVPCTPYCDGPCSAACEPRVTAERVEADVEALTSLVLYALQDAHHRPGGITMLDLAKHVAAALVERPAEVEHDEWCPASGCRCGKCPCAGPPLCLANQPAAPQPTEGVAQVVCTNCEADDLGCTACGAHGTLAARSQRPESAAVEAVARVEALAGDLSEEIEELRADVPPVGAYRVAHLYRTAGLSDARDRLRAALRPEGGNQ